MEPDGKMQVNVCFRKVLRTQFAVSTLDQFVGNFESSVVLMYVLICPKCYKSHLIQLAYFQSAYQAFRNPYSIPLEFYPKNAEMTLSRHSSILLPHEFPHCF